MRVMTDVAIVMLAAMVQEHERGLGIGDGVERVVLLQEVCDSITDAGRLHVARPPLR